MVKKEILSYYYENLDSTMDEAHRLMDKGIIEKDQIVLISTEKQSAGKGTRGKSWASPYGAGIYISAVFKFGDFIKIKIGDDFSTKVTMILIEAINDYLSHRGSFIELDLKCPNDIFFRGSKLAGVLIEYKPHEYLIIGIGINWKKADWKIKELQAQAPKASPISIEEILHEENFKKIDKNELEQWIISALAKRLTPEYPFDS